MGRERSGARRSAPFACLRSGDIAAYRGAMRDTWITLREAAALSGLTTRSIYALCRLGVIRARTVRGRWRVHRGDFMAWIGGL